MYHHLTGKLALRKPTHAVVDCGGVGYRVEIPLSTYERLPAEGTVTLHTWLQVTDNDLRLFGFATEREREIFLRMVEGVQQLGPAKAIAILSSASPDELARAIDAGDVAFLRNIRGIGEKLANRLIVELKGKLPDPAGKDAGSASVTKDAVAALVRLGYDRRAAEEAVGKARKELGNGAAAVEDVIKRSLSHV